MNSLNRPTVCIYPNTLEPRMHSHSASARIRGQWVAKYLRKAGWDVDLAKSWKVDHTRDIHIFQKVYEHPKALPLARQLKKDGKAVILDVCDSDWLDRRKVVPLIAFLKLCTAAVGSSPIISAWLSRYAPTFTIGDGVDLEAHPGFKEHEDKKHLKVVWFGNQSTFKLIQNKIPQVVSMGHKMVTISDHPQATKKWSLATVNNDILDCDIFWDPRGNGYEYECKTNNKELKAWALGIPVTHDTMFVTCLRRFGTAVDRNKEAKYRLEVIKQFWVMDVVIRQWETVITAVWEW